VAQRFPADTSAAGSSLYLLADLWTDEGDDQRARETYEKLYKKYPTSARTADARFQTAIIALAHGEPRAAAAAFDSLYALLPSSSEAQPARYWAGRAWAMAGDSAAARARWSAAIRQGPTSYYAVVAAERLGDSLPTPGGAAAAPKAGAALDSAFARAALLERLGMDVEAKFEYDAIEDGAMT